MSRQSVLSALVKSRGWTVGVELGVFKGATFFYLLNAHPNLVLTGVDRWERTGGPKQDRVTGFASYAHEPMELYAEEVTTRAQAYGARARILRMETAAAAREFDDNSVDFVFIDASHDTASVTADIRAWLGKIRPDGALVGHDFSWPSVREAVRMELDRALTLPSDIWLWNKGLA